MMERRTMNVPVRVGDELEVTIEAVGEKGDGIAKVGGFVLFVPSTKEGDVVTIKVTRVLRRVGFAEVVGKAKKASAREKRTSEEPEEESEEEPGEEPEEETEEKQDEDSEDTENFGEDSEEEKGY